MTFVIEIEHISRSHCEILNENGNYFLRDLGSIKGTYIKIMRREIKIGDIYEIGSMYFKVVNQNVASKPRNNMMDNVL